MIFGNVPPTNNLSYQIYQLLLSKFGREAEVYLVKPLEAYNYVKRNLGNLAYLEWIGFVGFSILELYFKDHRIVILVYTPTSNIVETEEANKLYETLRRISIKREDFHSKTVVANSFVLSKELEITEEVD